MDSKQSEHLARVRRLRESFAEANERLVARLRGATDDAAARATTGGWTPAQIGWHVAAVTNRFAGLISGEVAGAQPLPAEHVTRPWADVVAAIPPKLKAPESFHPPAKVTREEAISALEGAGMRLARALDRLTPERGRLGITSAVVGTISLYQVGEWATAHVIRHNKQCKLALGEG
jgi:hypothetical protein